MLAERCVIRDIFQQHSLAASPYRTRIAVEDPLIRLPRRREEKEREGMIRVAGIVLLVRDVLRARQWRHLLRRGTDRGPYSGEVEVEGRCRRRGAGFGETRRTNERELADSENNDWNAETYVPPSEAIDRGNPGARGRSKGRDIPSESDIG